MIVFLIKCNLNYSNTKVNIIYVIFEYIMKKICNFTKDFFYTFVKKQLNNFLNLNYTNHEKWLYYQDFKYLALGMFFFYSKCISPNRASDGTTEYEK